MEKLIIVLLVVPLLLSPVKNDENVIRLTVDDINKIELKENRSTGYQWFYEIEDKEVIEVVEDYYKEPAIKGMKAGSSGIHHWKIKGIKKGKTKLRFILAREESYNKIEKERIYTVIVNK